MSGLVMPLSTWAQVSPPSQLRYTPSISTPANTNIDVSGHLQLLNLAEASYSQLLVAIPYFTDEQLVEAYNYASSLGKRARMVQAAIWHEAKKRSI